MPTTLIKQRLRTNKQKPKIKPGLNNTEWGLPPNLQSFEPKLLSGSGVLVYKWA